MYRAAVHALFAILLVAVTGGVARAEYYGMLNGRLADLSRLPDASIEGGVVLGDLFEADYQHFGARFNYRASPDLMLYFDLGQTEVEFGNVDADGFAFGVGGYYVVEGVFATTDFALKASFHRASLERDGFGFGDEEVDFDGLVLEGLVSGRNRLGANRNIGWYANLGVHRLDLDGDDETELGFGGGIVVPRPPGGEFYAGLDLIDEMTFGAGYRFFLN